MISYRRLFLGRNGMQKHGILIVDDEPIMLSYIKTLLDWDSLDVEVVGTARNGREALDFIEHQPVDIVMADIGMPVMDGISLLRESNEISPDTVFIMLTSMEEFRLAKEALALGAVDYLLKVELDADGLSKAVLKAREESIRRSIYRQKLKDTEIEARTAEFHISELLRLRSLPLDASRALSNAGFLEYYAFLAIVIDPYAGNGISVSDEDMAMRSSWTKEISSQILSSFDLKFHEVSPVSSENCMLVYFLSRLSMRAWNVSLEAISERICNSTAIVLNQDVDVIHGSMHSGLGELDEAREEFEHEMTRYYLGKRDVHVSELRLENTILQIERAIASKDFQSFDVAMRLVRDRIENVDHQRGQVSFFLDAFSYAVRSGFKGTDLESEGMKIAESIEHDMLHVVKRRDSLKLVDDARCDIASILSSRESHNEAIAKAKLYILSHVEKQLSLAEIADNSCLSPGYLSALFKKTTGISVVEYVNQSKIERAKELISNGMRRVDEMAEALGFENIYYFSKVFKKFTGLPPTEYVRRMDER